MMLFAPNPAVMQRRINQLTASLNLLELEINSPKCQLHHLHENKKSKFSYLCSDTVCTINSARVPMVGVADHFRYLGVDFDYRGIKPSQLDPDGRLDRLDKAPIKQRRSSCKYEILLKYLLLRYHNPLTFHWFSKKALEFLDTNVKRLMEKVAAPPAWYSKPGHSLPNPRRRLRRTVYLFLIHKVKTDQDS